MYSKFALVVAAAVTAFADVPDVIDIKASPIAGCGFNKTISWAAIPQGCDAMEDNFDGGTYFPSLVFHLEKEIDAETDHWVVVENSKKIVRCNTDGEPNTENFYIWNVPEVLPKAYSAAGGPGHEDKKRFRIGAWFLSNPSGTTFQSKIVTFGASCTFATDGDVSDVCTESCWGPTARCVKGECTCYGGRTRQANGECSLTTTTPVMIGPGDDGQACKATEPKCNQKELVCTDNKCVVPEDKPVVNCHNDLATCQAACALDSCGKCRTVSQNKGITCAWCSTTGVEGSCIVAGPETCPAGSTLVKISNDCPEPGNLTPEAPSADTTVAKATTKPGDAPVPGATTKPGDTPAGTTVAGTTSNAQTLFVSAAVMIAMAAAF